MANFWEISETVLLENSSNPGASYKPFYWKTHPVKIIHIIYGLRIPPLYAKNGVNRRFQYWTLFWTHNGNEPTDKNHLVDLHLNYVFQVIWIMSPTHDVIKLNIKLTAQKSFTWQISKAVVFGVFWIENLITYNKNKCCHHKHFSK